MGNTLSQRIGGLACGLKLRSLAIARYYADPIICKSCRSVIHVGSEQKASAVRRKQFCTMSCSQRFNNRLRKKIHYCGKCGDVIERTTKCRRKYCDVCRPQVRFVEAGLATKGQIFKRARGYQSARSQIRRHAEVTFNRSGKPRSCAVCSYTRHVEVAHKKPVAGFSNNATLEQINHIDNLVCLCPTHHWEFDNGILSGFLP